MCALVFGVKGHDIHHFGGFRKHTCVQTHKDVAPGEGWTKLLVLFFKAVCYLDILLGEDWREVARFRIGLQKEGFRLEATHGQHRIEGSWFCPFKENFRWPCVPVLTTDKVCWDAHVPSQPGFITAETIPGELSRRPWVLMTINNSLTQGCPVALGWGHMEFDSWGHTNDVQLQQNFSTSQDHSNSKFCF